MSDPAEARNIRGNLIRPYGAIDLKELGIPTESSDADAANGRLYFHLGDNSIKYKDADGNIWSGKQGDVSNPMQNPLDANGQDINNVGTLEANNISITPVYDVTLNFDANESKVGLGSISPVSGQLIATARPVESNTNFLQASVDSIRYNSSDNAYSVNISETMGNSGYIKLTVWEVGL